MTSNLHAINLHFIHRIQHSSNRLPMFAILWKCPRDKRLNRTEIH